jgi:hypothetical protein
MSLKPETTQKIFITWFGLLTMIAIFNFYRNLTDASTQSELERSYRENKDRYEQSIDEHDTFKADINYLKGRVACTNHPMQK